MKAGRAAAALVACVALLPSACMPSDKELGIVQDTPRDPMISVSVSASLAPLWREITLHSNGHYQATCQSGDSVFRQEGVLPARAWQEATTALDRAGVWQARSTSYLRHVIRPSEPDREARIAALPDTRTIVMDGDTTEIEWRRGDGRRKYLFDVLNQPTQFQPYKDLLSAADFDKIVCR